MTHTIKTVPNQYGSQAVLIRTAWCKRSRHRILANLSRLDLDLIESSCS